MATVAIVALVLAIAGIVATFGYFKWKAGSSVSLDANSFCPVTGPVSATVVLLDLTDPVTRPTLQDIENKFEELIQSVPVGGLLSIYGLTERTGEIIKKYSACNPGEGTDVDPIIANARLVQKRWESGYRKPFQEFIEGLSNKKSASHSPIMAGIQQVSLLVFNAPQIIGGQMRLIVVSDMIENTDVYSHYRLGATYDDFLKSPAFNMFRTNLNNVEVTILFIQRLKSPVKSKQLIGFWADWFLSNGVRRPDFRAIRLVGAT